MMVKPRSRIDNKVTGTWTKRDDKTGKFMDVKASKKSFKGVRKAEGEGMTEREYVETLLSRAEAYIAWVGQSDLSANNGERVMRLWATTKEKLSAHTMRELCKAWLESQAKDKKGDVP